MNVIALGNKYNKPSSNCKKMMLELDFSASGLLNDL